MAEADAAVEAEPEVVEDPGPTTLAQAILRVQAKLDTLDLGRNADGQIQSRTYKYLTYSKLLEQVRPLLAENELLWQTFPTTLDGRSALRYRLTFASPFAETEEVQEETMLLAVTEDMTSQGQGSAISYARRYALQAVFEIAPDDDDDGAQATREASRQRQDAVRHAPVTDSTLLTADRLQRMTARIRQAGLEPTEVFEEAGITEPMRVTVGQANEVKEIIAREEES